MYHILGVLLLGCVRGALCQDAIAIQPVPIDPPVTCATILCIEGHVCEEYDGKPECVPIQKPGVCPRVDYCDNDYDCEGRKKCCFNGCGRACIEPVKPDCFADPDVGPCDAVVPRFYYDAETGKCAKFIWGGCGGNTNNFETKQHCEVSCNGNCVRPMEWKKVVREYECCGPQCPPYRLCPCSDVKEYRCVCPDEAPIRQNGRCITEDQCDDCPYNQVWNPCGSGSGCIPTCEDKKSDCFAAAVCVPGCECPKGTVLRADGWCVKDCSNPCGIPGFPQVEKDGDLIKCEGKCDDDHYCTNDKWGVCCPFAKG